MHVFACGTDLDLGVNEGLKPQRVHTNSARMEGGGYTAG